MKSLTKIALVMLALAGVLVPARLPADPISATPAFSQDKLPYHLKWGHITVVVEVEHGVVGDDDPHQFHQVRIVDASGHLLNCIKEVDRVEDVRLIKPLIAGEQGLLIGIAGGNSGLEDYYGFGTGVSNRFHVSDAIQVDVKDLNGDGTAEIVAVYRLADIDGGGVHHGSQVTVVYQWNGAKYVEATRRFPALTRAREKEDQSALVDIEAKASQSSADAGASEPEIDGHLNAAIGYLTNAMIAGDDAEARTWLKDNVTADRLHLSGEVNKSVLEAMQSMASPLPQDSGDDSEAPIPAPNTAAPNTAARITAQHPQSATAGLVPGQSLGFVKIGQARVDVIAAFKVRPTDNYDLKHGLVEDEWNNKSTDGSGEYRSALVWYRQGKVVQVQTTIAEQQKRYVPSFNTLIARDRGLKEICYGMGCYDASGEPAGGANFYCFDDVKRGIAFGIGVNGDAYMTNKPDTIIIHVAGVPYIPFRGLTNVTLVTGADAVLYQNQGEQDRAVALEKTKKSRAGANKRR